jgi:5-methylcytosine-specific restriction endonuclease McrA
MKKKIPKEKNCANPDCDKSFLPYKTTDKYCSFSCASKFAKPLKRTPLKPRTTFLQNKTLEERKSMANKGEYYKTNKERKKKESAFEKEFTKKKAEVKKNVIKEHGKLVCEKCGTDHSIQFSVHHIIFRSERPKHPMLNHLLNLIFLCYDCHTGFHRVKSSRHYLIVRRKLWTLFGKIRYSEDVCIENGYDKQI